LVDHTRTHTCTCTLKLTCAHACHTHTRTHTPAHPQASKREAKAAAGLILKEELRARQRVLRRLGYATSEGVVTLKGRVS